MKDSFFSETRLRPSSSLILSQVLGPRRDPAHFGSLAEWDLVEVIGQGSIGLVFLARRHQDPDRRDFALKMLKPEFVDRPNARSTFIREARIAQRLDHPNVLPILDWSEDTRLPFLVTPYMSRGNLADWIYGGKDSDRGNPESNAASKRNEERAARFLPWAVQLADALNYIHHNRLIHRDIKPSNILINEDNEAVLADFGLVRGVDHDSLWDAGADNPIGTLPYMSPRILQGKPEDPRDDIYSLGVVFYELLTGKPAFHGGHPEEIRGRILHGKAEAVRTRNPRAPKSMARIAEWAMASDSRARYAFAEDLLADLKRVERKHPPIGPKRSAVPRGAKAASGLRWAAGILMALAVLLAGLFDPRWELELSRTIPLQLDEKFPTVHLGEWDADGDTDLFALAGKKVVVRSTAVGAFPIHRLPYPDEEDDFISLLSDIDGDGRDEIFVNSRATTNVIVRCYNQNMMPLREFAATGSYTNLADNIYEALNSRFHYPLLRDLDGDGSKEFVTTLETGYLLRPRALLCFDFETERLKWRYDTGPLLSTLYSTDLDGDGRFEIIATAQAVSNGNAGPDGTSDDESYVGAWNAEGRLLWRYISGDAYTYTGIHSLDFSDDPRRRILATAIAAPEARRIKGLEEVGRIFTVSADGERGAEHDFGRYIHSTHAGDFDGDGSNEALVCDEDGWLHHLDDRLNLIQKVKLAETHWDRLQISILGAEDLDGDGDLEILLKVSEREILHTNVESRLDRPPTQHNFYNVRVLVIDHRLKPLASYVVFERTKSGVQVNSDFRDLDGDGEWEILVLSDDARVLRMARKWMRKIPFLEH